uniref:Putative Tetratricopeptide repeat (TPR)-like superfamily protein n=1 Tax=Davidia involucrata TaxID=16924 RepID=A0A5B7A411_DAVIN
MVVIEPVPKTTEENKPATTDHSNSSKDTATVAGYASDGFETASESEVIDDDDHEERRQQSVPPTDESHEVALTDEELEQKALAQASDAKLEGNKLFGDGQYEEALSNYELALQVAPDTPSSVEIRSICHANRGTCFVKLGQYKDAIEQCSKALELNPKYVKALLRRGEAHEKLENFEEAIADMKKILELDESHVQAKRTIGRLEPLAAAKREKMKEEMIGKLKEMGNSVLGRFGMSIDNFKAVQDPKTGSYSVSFQR